MGRSDLFRQFQFLVQEKEQALLAADRERSLTEQEKKALQWTQERLTARLHSSWQLFDRLIYLTAYGSQEELKPYTAEPEK